MVSLIPGYEYDIFISYRQKDNKHDGWVTEFVDNLKGELESTFKEDLSIYFDENPHDGLLETHSVDKSLEGKMKCLIFIPIISQTYCDSKSFAWQHELCAFNKLAKEDQFGRDIKLSSGNVASRILTVKIHDLDPEDKTLLENELGGFIRGIEFIYKEPGVNRPLKPEDDEKKNLNGTKYLNQINKLANAVKEIINALKKQCQHSEEVNKQDFEVKLAQRNNLKTKIIIASAILIALLILGYFFIPKLFKPSENLEKSIAVLPFKSLSNDPEKQYQADGMMDAITLHLSKIKDLRVMSRTSVEQYRGTTKTTKQIGKELDVEYLLEGSFQKSGDDAKLIVQLIKANEESHAWGNEYNIKWSEIFTLQSEVAQSIARELNAAITPEVKQIIEKIPTINLTAYDFYQRGREEQIKYWLNTNNRESLERAEKWFHKTIKLDSTFAQAYLGLAMIYWDKHYWETIMSEDFLDSVLILSNIALSFNNQLSDAYMVKGKYYSAFNKTEQAKEEFDKALNLNPNDPYTYISLGNITYKSDCIKSIEYYQKAATLERGKLLPNILRSIGSVFMETGFTEKAKNYIQEAYNIDRDSLIFNGWLSGIEYVLGNYLKESEYDKKIYSADTTNTYNLFTLGYDFMLQHKHKEAFIYLKKWIERQNNLNSGEVLFRLHRVAWAFGQNGYKKEAEFYLNTEIKNSQKVNKLERDLLYPLRPYYDLAAAYALKGEKEIALKNLRIYSQVPQIDLEMLNLLKNDPLFDSIRNESDFQRIVRDLEAKYQAEHDRVRKWLEEKGIRELH